MAKIFDIIYQFLTWISAFTGLTYREVNIVIYFIVIPAFFFYLISRITKQKWVILSFLLIMSVGLVIIQDFESFSSNVFDLSVDLLNWFEIVGLNYVQASVVICVIVPILILLLLLKLNCKQKSNP